MKQFNSELNIVSFSVPFPANYGGVIDVFYKLKALSELDFKITLHCFQYDRKPSKELENLCEQVYYYPRKMIGNHLLSFYPFIVGSRKSEKLVENLLKTNSPILFEGLHSCYSINDERLRKMKKLVRSHNIEHDYYSALSSYERNPLKRLYFKSEAKKLKRFEPLALKEADFVLGISQKDTVYLKDKYENAVHISAFHAFDAVSVPQSTSDFSLYHGNLGVGENNQAALFLANQVFRGLNQKLIIAGNNPSVQLQNVVCDLPNVELKYDLSSKAINNLIHQAHINILPTFQNTGIKLKLLAALFNGSHCLVNNQMIDQTGLEDLVIVANSAKEFKRKVLKLSSITLSDEQIYKRKKTLDKFSNKFNINKLSSFI